MKKPSKPSEPTKPIPPEAEIYSYENISIDNYSTTLDDFLDKVKSRKPPGTATFEIQSSEDEDFYSCRAYLSWSILIPNPKLKEQTLAYENKLKTYEIKYRNYLKQLERYKIDIETYNKLHDLKEFERLSKLFGPLGKKEE